MFVKQAQRADLTGDYDGLKIGEVPAFGFAQNKSARRSTERRFGAVPIIEQPSAPQCNPHSGKVTGSGHANDGLAGFALPRRRASPGDPL